MNWHIPFEKIKPPLFVVLTGAMPFLDDHTDKIITSFMAIFAIEEGMKSYKKSPKRKKK